MSKRALLNPILSLAMAWGLTESFSSYTNTGQTAHVHCVIICKIKICGQNITSECMPRIKKEFPKNSIGFVNNTTLPTAIFSDCDLFSELGQGGECSRCLPFSTSRGATRLFV